MNSRSAALRAGSPPSPTPGGVLSLLVASRSDFRASILDMNTRLYVRRWDLAWVRMCKCTCRTGSARPKTRIHSRTLYTRTRSSEGLKPRAIQLQKHTSHNVAKASEQRLSEPCEVSQLIRHSVCFVVSEGSRHSTAFPKMRSRGPARRAGERRAPHLTGGASYGVRVQTSVAIFQTSPFTFSRRK